MVELDKIDRRMIYELDHDSRQSISSLAKRIGIAKSVAAYRIRQMEKRGVIKGYYTAIDTVKIGYPNFRAYIRLKEASVEEREEVIQYLVDSKTSWWVATTGFPYDIAVIFLARDLHGFDEAFREFLGRFRKRIFSYQVNPYVELRHYFREYILHDEPREKRRHLTIGDERRVALSGKEDALLRLLAADSRQGSMALARKLGISPITVKGMIKRLMKERVILAFRVLVDYSKIGYGYYWIHLDVSDMAEGERIRSYVAAFPHTVYMERTIGGIDVEFGVQIDEKKGIDALMEDIIARFGPSITRYEHFRIHENRKALYMPQL